MSRQEQPTSTSLLKPLRGFQLLLSMFLFHLGICLLSIPISYMTANACLILINTSFIYICITSAAIMSQRDSDAIRISAMFAFCLLGMPIFIVVGLMCYAAALTDSTYWGVRTILLLCFMLAGAFLVEILMVLPISRKNKRILARMPVFEEKTFTEEQPPMPPPPPPPPPPAEPTKRDLTTSVSSLRLPPDADETATPDHSYRKVSFGRRREYVDSPTSVPSIAAVKIAEIQTEPKRVSVEGSQTCKCELKEVLVQTVSRCEFCHQQMQAAAVAPSQPPAICGPPCPTIVQLLRGGIALPCCTNCSCATGVLQIEQQKQQPQQLQYQKQEQSQPPQLEYQEQEQSQPPQLEYQEEEQSQPQQLQYQKPEKSQSQLLQNEKQDLPQPQQQKIIQKTQQVQPEEQRMQRVLSKETTDRGDSSQGLTSFTKVTVTAFCTTPNATTMEIATSSGSKENVITTYIPPQAAPSTEITGRPQIVTTSQQTEKASAFMYSKVHRVTGAQGQEIESNKEETIFASECYDMERSIIDDEEYSKPPPPPPPPQTTDVSTLKSDDDDFKSDKDIKDVKRDSKESKQIQTPKTSKDITPTSTAKGRRGRDQATPARQAKRTKKSGGQSSQKEKEKEKREKEEIRTYSRFLPLEDVKMRDPRCIEQDYDMSNICVPMHTHEVAEFPSCSGRTMPSVFHRNNRIDPVCIPECDNYAIQTDNPHFQCDIVTPAETSTTLPVTTATTDTDICPACRKEQVHFPQADIFQYYNVYKDRDGRVYCDICAPPNSNKVPIITNRSEDILQECSICGNFPYIIDARSVGVTCKYEERSAYCIKCGQLQS